MSIASRLFDDTQGTNKEFPDFLLLEPAVAHLHVERIVADHITDENTRATEFAQLLSVIREGVEAGEKMRTTSTIDLLIEFAHLRSEEHRGSLERFRAEAEGRVVPGGQTETREESQEEQGAETQGHSTGAKDTRELLNERFCELVDDYGAEPRTRELLVAILEAKAAPEDVAALRRAVGFLLAEAMSNSAMPVELRNALNDAIVQIENDAPSYASSPELLPLTFPLLIEARERRRQAKRGH
jgi:hypothetical protein